MKKPAAPRLPPVTAAPVWADGPSGGFGESVAVEADTALDMVELESTDTLADRLLIGARKRRCRARRRYAQPLLALPRPLARL